MEQFSDFLCFRLGALSRRIARYYNNRFTDLGITIGQSFVLFYLLQRDGSNVKDIAAAVQLDSPAVTGLVDRLIKQGLVNRQDDPEDRRSVQIYLTEHGRQVSQEAQKIAREFNLYLNETETTAAVTGLESLLTQLEQQNVN